MKNILSVIILFIAFISCEKGEEQANTAAKRMRIEAGITSLHSRVSSLESGDYVFDKGDEIGVFVAAKRQLPVRKEETWNILHTYSGTEWIAEKMLAWLSQETGTQNDVIGYYPYKRDIEDFYAEPFTLSVFQNTITGLQKNDVMYGKVTATKTLSNDPVPLELSHKFVQLSLNIAYGDEGDAVAEIEECNIRSASVAKLDLMRGTVGEVGGEIVRIKPYLYASAPEGYKYAFSAILPPQHISRSMEFIEIKINNQLLVFKTDIDLKSGKHYTLHLTLNKGKLELTALFVSAWEGGIRITDKNYSKVKMYQHGEVIPYQVNRTINPVTLVFVGDGFTTSHMLENGYYDQCLNKAIRALMGTAPYATYSHYFNIYKIAAVSEEEGADNNSTGEMKNTFFNAQWSDNYGDMSCDYDVVFDFVQRYCPDIQSGATDIDRVAIIVIVNDARYGGICWTWASGRSYCMCPVSFDGAPISWRGGYEGTGINTGDWTNTVVHEGGGHCFGKLLDEYSTYLQKFPEDVITSHYWPVPVGWNLTEDTDSIPWQSFRGKPGYEKVRLYEGGSGYFYGIWRSELISCMIDNRFYFNASSRELIVKRIKSLAGESYSLEEFMSKDSDYDPTGKENRTVTAGARVMPPTAPPVLIQRIP